MKVFISYSHKDEDYLDRFKAHLAPLMKEASVELFTDRLLLPGDALNPEIEKALNSSDIFIFLVSADFLSSAYCVEKELKTALDRYRDRSVSLVSVIVRPCDWTSTDLGQFLALPRDGKPVSKWSTADDAYLNVVNELRRLIRERSAEKGDGGSDSGGFEIQFDPDWLSYLSSTDITYSNPRKTQLYLDDIYVSPHLLKQSTEDSEHIRTYTFIEDIADSIQEQPYWLISGKSQSGKTILIKRLVSVLADKNLVPIVLNGPEIGSTNIERILKKILRDQYNQPSDPSSLESNWTNCIFVIDNFDRAKLNARHQEKFIEKVKALGSSIVVFMSESVLLAEREYINESSGFEVCSIQDFGHVKRNELIKRWLQAGVEETIDEADLLRKRKQFETHVNSIIRNNLVPARPVFLLSIIQSLETASGGDFRLTSYGHCYNALIEKALRGGAIRVDEIDSFVNLMTNFAYKLFIDESTSLGLDAWAVFIQDYSREYLAPEDPLDKLVSSGLLKKSDGRVRFSHKYIFYYYAAKHFAVLVEEHENISPIERLCENLHVEANANVLIFVTHHSRSKRVIEEISLYADEAFAARGTSRLSAEETRFLAKNVQEIPELIIEAKDVEEAREDDAVHQDELASTEDEEDVASEFSGNKDYGIDDEIFADIASSARTVEIIGQIVRNRHGSLSKSELEVLAESGMRCGLRFLDFFVSLMKESENDVLDMVARSVGAQRKPLTKPQKQRLAVSFYSHYSYGGVLAILMKIASSLGHEKLIETLTRIEGRHPDHASIKLINAAIRMEFSRDFPKEKVHEVYEATSGNVVARRILKHIVVRHLYLNYVDRKTKQWIAQQMKIPISEQLRIEGKESEKRFARTK